MRQLLDSASDDTASESAYYYSGMAWLVVAGDLGGGTVTAQLQTPDGQWVDLLDSGMAEPGAQVLFAPPGRLRLRLAGATDARVNAWFG